MTWERDLIEMISGRKDGSIMFGTMLVGALILGGGYVLYQRFYRPSILDTIKTKKGRNSDWTKEIFSTSNSRSGGDAPSSLKSIWNPLSSSSSNKGKKSNGENNKEDDRPFGSSYYYAHNDPRATGGYKDGLKMEDYQMETPRLLSKGGQEIRRRNSSNQEENENNDNNNQKVPASSSSKTSKKQTPKSNNNQSKTPIVPISKYLWDDPGDHKWIGTIRIDELPGGIPWKSLALPGASAKEEEYALKDIRIDLSNDFDELTVEIDVLSTTNAASTKTFQLRIRQLYGKVASVKKIVQSKRLLLRLYKLKPTLQQSDVMNSSWPHPYKA